MQEDLELSVGIGGEKAFLLAIQQMIAATEKLTSAVDKLGKEGEESSKGVEKVGKKSKEATDIFTKMGGLLAGAAVIGGIKSFGQAAYQAAADYETLSIQLGVLLGDAKKVPGILEEWKKFSDVTPFEPEQVNKAGRQLLGFGIAVDDIIPKMTMLGDISAGTGKDFNELVGIYGKALAKGKVQGEVLDMLADATINIIPYLAQAMGVAKEEVAKLGSEGKISIEAFDKALALMTSSGSRYGGMMDKLSQSTEGILSTLKGEFDTLLREVGQGFLPIFKEMAIKAIPMVQEAVKMLRPYLAELPKFFDSVKETAMSIIDPLMRIWDSIQRIFAPLMEAGEGFRLFGGAMEAVMPRFDTIAWALDILAIALDKVADAGQWVADTWNWAFGLAEDEVEGLSNNSKVYIKEFTTYAQKQFGATGAQVQAFAKTLQASEFAGKSQAEAVQYMKDRFAAYIETCDGAAGSTDKLGKSMSDVAKKAIPAAGSIDALNERLKVLKDQYNATASASERLRLGGLIQDAEIQVELMNAQGEAMGNVAMKTQAVNDQFTKLQATTGNMMRSTDGMGSMHEMLMQIPLDLETTTTAWERFQAKIGEGASGQLKQGIDNIKNAFRDFGAQAAESIGYAIGSAGSAAQAFKAAVSQMLVQIPKLAGMALLNAAAFPANAAISLPLAAAGLALLGLSGIIGGVQAKNAREQEALADSMSDLPTSATGAAGAASLGGLGGYTGASQQQAPVMVNVNAEMDGVQLGGLIKRVTTNYNKTTIKQR